MMKMLVLNAGLVLILAITSVILFNRIKVNVALAMIVFMVAYVVKMLSIIMDLNYGLAQE